MIGKQIRPRGQGPRTVWIAAGALQVLVALLVYYYSSSHSRLQLAQCQHDASSGDLPTAGHSSSKVDSKAQLAIEREALQRRVFTFNQQASALGESKQELTLDLASSRHAASDSSNAAASALRHTTTGGSSTPAAEDSGSARRQAVQESVRGALGSMATLTAAALGSKTGGSSAAALVALAGGGGAAAGGKAPLCIDEQDPRYPMKTPAQVAQEAPELAEALAKYAINGEIMFALVNGVMICENKTICWWDGGNVLKSFMQILKHVNVTNYLIGALDDESANYLRDWPGGANWFRPNVVMPDAQKSTHPANRVSTVKYTLLQQILQLGYHTLITDMDLVYMQNPFHHLHRDADVESQTDGFDDMAYGTMGGVQDKTMGWGGGGLYMQTFTTNVGCIYFKANPRTYKLVKRVADDLAAHSAWDQQVFNQHLMTVSHGERDNPYASLRIMDYMKFMNSKIFFRTQRSRFMPGKTSTAEAPVMVHFNYHPDKHKRMLCIMARYFDGKLDACDAFPGGSEKGT